MAALSLRVVATLGGAALASSLWKGANWGVNIYPEYGVSCVAGDFNGDGLTDIACESDSQCGTLAAAPKGALSPNLVLHNGRSIGHAPSSTQCPNGSYYVWFDQWLSTGSTFTHVGHPGDPGHPDYITAYLQNGNGNCLVGDYSGDGRGDLACVWIDTSGTGHWELLLAGTPTINNAFTAMATPIQGQNYTTLPFGVSDMCFAGSFFGSGRSDVGCQLPDPNFQSSSNSWTLIRFNAAGSTLQYAQSFITGPSISQSLSAASACYPGDINGDGLTDLICNNSIPTSQTSTWNIALSTGAGAIAATLVNSSATGPTPQKDQLAGACLPGDFNGDGITDLACFNVDPTHYKNGWTVYLSIGTHLSTNPNYAWTDSFVPASPMASNCFVADIDGDGKSDIICATQNASMPFRALLSTGSGFVDTPVCSGSDCTGIPNPPVNKVNDYCQVGDFNGDGKADIVCLSSGGTWQLGLSPGP